MTATTPAISPLRQRMIDDMRLRKLADKTQSHYLRAVRQFSLFLGHSPDRATIEDLRRYQLHLVDQGISAISLNAAIIGLKFFFDVTLDHPQLMRKMQLVRIPRTLIPTGWPSPISGWWRWMNAASPSVGRTTVPRNERASRR
jgi:integrase/recombinase XerD